MKDFFAKYYVPCNVSLVVAGDFDPAAIKPVIAQLFGTLPRGSTPVHRDAKPVRLSGVVRSTMSDEVQFAKTYLVYHSPAAFQPGDAEMDLIAATLAEGISSRLYQKLVYENPLASEVERASGVDAVGVNVPHRSYGQAGRAAGDGSNRRSMKFWRYIGTTVPPPKNSNGTRRGWNMLPSTNSNRCWPKRTR